MNRVNIFKSILWAITGVAIAFGMTRMLFGLGSVSNLSDATPWGIWKGLNVVPGIALAGGGFVVTAIIYIMRREEFHRYAKVSVLLAFLGYLTAATALVVELGLPWMVWHPIIYWQHHSALFEISWCVMLYLTVLFLEFIPVPLEETGRLAGIRKFLTKYKIVLVFLGVMISTLHQSSLGTLFLIIPEKLHPLWYSSLLPILFFVSAVATGPLMLILAVLTISHLYRKPLENDILSKLGFASMIVLAIYGLIRLIDIGVEGKFAIAFDGSWQSAVFWIEIVLFVGLPVLLLVIPRWRRSTPALWLATTSAVLGMGLDRANIAGVMLVQTGEIYLPTMYEIMISLGILAAAILVFLFCLERYKIWEVKWEDPREKPEASPEFSRPADVWLGTPRVAGRTVYSLIFIVALSFGLAVISTERIRSAGAEEIPVTKAHGGDTLFVNGNRDGSGVSFAHEEHVKRLGEKESCVLCHHMNLPLDKQSGCHTCHSRMYTPADVFRHDWHASPDGANLKCGACHREDLQRTAQTAKQCQDCHKDLFPSGTLVQINHYNARSYTDAMHGMCMKCHQKNALTLVGKEKLAQCATCHKTGMPEYLPPEIENYFRDTTFNHVTVPSIDTAGMMEEEPSI